MPNIFGDLRSYSNAFIDQGIYSAVIEKSAIIVICGPKLGKNGERKVVPARSIGCSAQGFFRKHAFIMSVRIFFWPTLKFPFGSMIFEMEYFSLKGCVISASLLKNKVLYSLPLLLPCRLLPFAFK